MKGLFLITVVLPFIVSGSDCNSKYKDANACSTDAECAWCTSQAVPSACYSRDEASRLPAAVFSCQTFDSDATLLVTMDTLSSPKTKKKNMTPSQDRDDINLRAGLEAEEGDVEEKDLCDDEVGQAAGYLKLGQQNKKYFYWFFESRSDPENDPVILWMTGGPGCSSQMALFVENGPCHLNADGTSTSLNEYSWNNKANIIYIDQPAGTGFSTGSMDHNEEQIGNDMYQFLTQFFMKYPKYQSNKFFVFGESYGGHYVPATSHRVWLGNKQRESDSPLPHINLAGVAVGNGLTNPSIQYNYYADMAYNSGTAPSRISKFQYTLMKEIATPACVKLIEKCNADDGDDHVKTCAAAQYTCTLGLIQPYVMSGYNNYDMRMKCAHPPLCYDFNDIQTYLNSASVQQKLGVHGHWEACSKTVGVGMMGDYMKNYHYKIPDMLADNIPVLIYAGDQDFVCNWLGNKAWTLALEWDGKDGFNEAEDVEFMVDGKSAGKMRTYGGFTFLQVYQAGHMVPMDQPANALEMVYRFTLGEIHP